MSWYQPSSVYFGYTRSHRHIFSPDVGRNCHLWEKVRTSIPEAPFEHTCYFDADVKPHEQHIYCNFYAIAPTIDDVDKFSPDENPDDEILGILENDDP